MTAPALNTPQRLIDDAMQDAALLQDGQVPTGEQYAKYTRRLLDVINTLQIGGLKLWTQTDLTVALVASQRDYSIGPGGDVDMTRPLRALQGYYLDENNNRRPIYLISRDEWMRLATTTQEGPVTQFFVQKLVDELQISFWLVPDTQAATGTAHLLIQQQITNFTNLYDEIDFPIEWYMCLRWGLAADICTGQPEAIVQRCERKFEFYRTALENWDVEDAPTTFTPDTTRGDYGAQRFR